MNKYKQKLISFAAAAAMIVSALPVQVGAVNRTDDAENYYYAIDGTEDWTKSSNAVEVISAGTTVTLTGNTESDDSATGNAYFKLPGNPPTSGNVTFSFTYTCSAGENGTRSSFSLVNMLPNNIDIDTAKDYGFGVANYTDSMRVPFNGDNNAYNDGNYNTATTYKINASVDYSSQTISYTIFDKDGNSLMGVSEYKDEYLSMENEKIDNIENFKFQYLIFYVRNGATITVSDFVIYAEGATPPTDEPTEAPVETETPVVTDTPVSPTDGPAEPSPTTGVPITDGNTLVYDLDTDDREVQGWITDANESSGIPQIPDVGDGGSATYDDSTEKLTLSNTDGGYRSQLVTFNPSSTTLPVQIDSVLTMTADGNGLINTGAGFYNVLSFKDNSDNILFTLRYGNDGAGDAHPSLYINDEHTGISAADDSESITFELRAVVDYSTRLVYVTIIQNGSAVYSYPLSFYCDENNDSSTQISVGGIGKIQSIIHRGDGSSAPRPSTVIDYLTIQNVAAPKIFVAGTGGNVGEDGIVNLTVEVGETVSMALLRNYDTDNVKFTNNEDAASGIVIYDSTTTAANGIRNDHAEVEHVPVYKGITVRGDSVGDLGPFTVTIQGTDGMSEMTVSRQFKIEVINATPATLAPETTLTPLATPQSLVDIDFDNEPSDGKKNYSYFDEYGTTYSTTEQSVWTSIEHTDNGLKCPPSATPAVSVNTNINDDAFYSYLMPKSGTEIGNGYRGSRLALDNELIQRTDKINVEYDFAFYNIVNTDNSSGTDVPVGMPTSITMTSEAIGAASIPFDFNENHFDEIDANPSDLETISKHLLTFFTGRPKRDNATGVHMIDMTNKLAYFDPLYSSENHPYGQYRETGIELNPNEYNFFHVSADIDFYNSRVTFTVENKTENPAGTKQTAIFTTSIPEYASWNGFIIASNKWDDGHSTDINGRDTEHYAYLDNIKATRIAVNNLYTDPTSVPTARPLPTDAVSFTDSNGSSGKEVTTEDTWAHYDAYTVQTPEPDKQYITYDSESMTASNFTYNIATDDSSDGVTSYTEFDFYLPKRGSYITLHLSGTSASSDGGSAIAAGNTITIGTSGVNSWADQENYTPIYDQELQCGQWYSMTLIYDLKDDNMKVILSDGNTDIAERIVSARNLNGSHYRQLQFNAPSITTVGNTTMQAPDREPSMAETYIANLRIYNRATVIEYYPEGTIANPSTGDAINEADEADEAVNDTRIGSLATDFVQNQVSGDDKSQSGKAVLVGTLDPPKSSDGRTFMGWKLIYSNGERPEYPTSEAVGGAVGNNANRIKYAAVYGALTSDSVESTHDNGYYYKVFYTDLPILENNYKTIDWYVYNGYQFRMWGNFDLTNLPHMTGEAEYRIGYVVYNIPVSDYNIIALPQAHHEAMTYDDKAQPTATPLPTNETTNPGTEAPAMTPPPNAPMPSSAPSPSNAPTPAAQ